MDIPVQEAKEIDAFEMRLADIGTVGVEQLHALSISVGWPHRAEDWEMLRNIGSGIVALDEIGRVLGSAMWFPHGDTFATVGMVITSPRLQALGTGNWLMQTVLSRLGDRMLRLSATRAARRLYLSLDFKPERVVYQRQGEATDPGAVPALASGAVIRPLETADLDAIIHLDAAGFGVARPRLMADVLSQSEGFGLFRGDRCEAFALCRRFGRGHVVGPLVSASDGDAIAVLAPHVAKRRGQFLRIDTHRESGEFTAFLSRAGMPVYDTVLTMSLGRSCFIDPNSASPDRPVTYALVSQALG
jgi:GNAT superfamily N-acetyltransferase